MNAVAVVIMQFQFRAAEITGAFTHRFEVAARREGLTCTRHDYAAQCLVCVDLFCGRFEHLAVAAMAQWIACLRAVDREPRDRSVFFQ